METKVTAIINLEDIPRIDLLNHLQSELLNGEPFGDSLITQLEYAIANRKRRPLPLPVNDGITIPVSETNNVDRT